MRHMFLALPLCVLVQSSACQGDPAAPSSSASPSAAAPFATETSARAAYDAKDWLRCAEQFVAIAATRRGDGVAELIYGGACCLALAGDVERAFITLERAIAAGMTNDGHIVRDTDLATLHADPRWPTLVETARSRRVAEEASLDKALRDELLAMVQEDQAARMAWIGNRTDDALRTRFRAIDAKNTTRMEQIVAQHGWPGKSLVGRDGAHAAWLLVQHADANPAFQRLCLDKMAAAVAAGQASATDHAYLHDRAAVAEGRPQRFGTQFGEDGPLPIEDAANVDARRAAVGLPTMAEDAAVLQDLRRTGGGPGAPSPGGRGTRK